MALTRALSTARAVVRTALLFVVMKKNSAVWVSAVVLKKKKVVFIKETFLAMIIKVNGSKEINNEVTQANQTT